MKPTKPAGKPAETRTEQFQIDVTIDGVEKTTYMVVTGIPKELPPEYDNTIVMAAERQFAQALNDKSFLEFYNPGKTAKDEQPVFFNINKVMQIQVIKIAKVEQ